MQIYMCCHCASPPANSLTCAVPQVEIIHHRTAFVSPADYVLSMFHHWHHASVEYSYRVATSTLNICSKNEGIASGAEKFEILIEAPSSPLSATPWRS